MVRQLIVIIFSLAFLFSGPAGWAADGGTPSSSHRSSGPRQQIATIIFSGLAGAVLGLSTLSFYGRPQDKLPNIAVGAALGIIVGASYTTYKAAVEPRSLYENSHISPGPVEPPQNLAFDRHSHGAVAGDFVWGFHYGFSF